MPSGGYREGEKMSRKEGLKIVVWIAIAVVASAAISSTAFAAQQGKIDSVKVTPALPDSVLPGGTITYTCWVRNTGDVPIIDGKVAYAIWNSDGVHVASHSTGLVITLRPGEAGSYTRAVTVPAGAMPGKYRTHPSLWNAQGKRLDISYEPGFRVGDVGHDYMRFKVISCELTGYDSTDAKCAYYDYGDVISTEWRVTNIGTAQGSAQRYSSCGLPHLGGAPGVSEKVYFQANGADTATLTYTVTPPRPGAWAIDVMVRQETCAWNRIVHYAWWPNVYDPVVVGRSAYIPAVYPKMLYYAPYSEVSVVTEIWNRGTEDLNGLVHVWVYDKTGTIVICETTGYLPIQAPARQPPWRVEADTTWKFTLPFAEALGRHKIKVEVSDTVAGGLMLLDRHSIWFEVPHLIYVKGQAEHYKTKMENGESKTLKLELYNLLNAEETFDLTLEDAPPWVGISPSSATIPKEGKSTGDLIVDVPLVPGATEHTFKVKMQSAEDPNIYDIVEVELALEVTILPKGIKESALAELEGIKPTGRKNLDREIDKVIGYAEKSLGQDLWLDYGHIECRHGHKVFNAEKEAVGKLMTEMNKRCFPGDLIDECRAVIGLFLDADKLLALIAIDEAAGGVPDYVATAVDEMDKAEEKRNGQDYAHAIDHYKKAWEYAQRAMGNRCEGGEQFASHRVVPRVFAVSQNDPNPFSTETSISFTLPVSGHTTLKIYDGSGRVVKTLLDDHMDAGVHCLTWRKGDATSGVYFYSLSSRGHSLTKKMVMLR